MGGTSPEPDPDNWSRCWSIQGEPQTMRAAVEDVHAALSDRGWDETAAFAVRLALEEGLTNALRHGHGGDPSLVINMGCTISAQRIELVIEDQGPGFEPETVPDPTADENLTIASGRGLALMRAFMTSVTVHPPGNKLTMTLER